jgi:hypothetical protein
MAVTYSIPNETDWVSTLLAKVMKDDHPALNDMGVRVGVILATSDNEHPAVRHGGYGAAATIRVVGLKDRLVKNYDAEMVIDETLWKEFSKERQAALLDHELSHLRLVTKDGEPQVDDVGRPKLKTVKADWFCGDGFERVVARRGRDAVEFWNAEQAHRRATAALAEEE